MPKKRRREKKSRDKTNIETKQNPEKFRQIQLTNPIGQVESMAARKAAYLLGKNLALRTMLRLRKLPEEELGKLNQQIESLAKGLGMDLTVVKNADDFSKFWEVRKQVLGPKDSVAAQIKSRQTSDCEGLFRVAAELTFASSLYTVVPEKEAESDLGKKQLEMNRILKFNIQSALVQAEFENRLEAVRAIDITIDWIAEGFPDGPPFRRVVRETFEDLEWMLESESKQR